MEKKSLIFILLVFVLPLIIASFPQFLFFQGEAKIDGRLVSEDVLISFSVNGIVLDSDLTDSEGNYDVFIQGFEEYYGELIDIFIDGLTAEEEIYYTSPQDVNLDLSAFSEGALKFSDYFPEENSVTAIKTGEIIFNATTSTGYDDSVDHFWFLDGEEISEFSDVNLSSFIYEVQGDSNGKHEIEVIASDGYVEVSREWELEIIRVDTSGFDGETTNLDSLGLDELGNVEDFVVEKSSVGKIEFLENANLTGIGNLDETIKIRNSVVAVDTSNYPQLSIPARITLTGLSYTNIPQIYYNSGFTTNKNSINSECDFCKLVSYTENPTTNGTVVFDVEHFSSFEVGESDTRYNVSSLGDLSECREGVAGNLEIEVNEPDENDEFLPGEKITVEVEVENNYEDDKKVIVEAVLYNIDEEHEEDADSDSAKIDSEEDEDFELTLEVPEDFEEDNYFVFVKVYEKDNEDEQCNYEIIEIELEREKHDVVIENIEVDSENVSTGKRISFFIDVKNIGEKDEDVYVEVTNDELEVYEKSGFFELEEFGEEDSGEVVVDVEMPTNASAGVYDFEINVVFGDEEDSVTKQIEILEAAEIEKETIYLSDFQGEELELKDVLETFSLEPVVKTPASANSLIKGNDFWENLNAILIFMIGIVAILIVFVIRR